jgi:hypothetical protein
METSRIKSLPWSEKPPLERRSYGGVVGAAEEGAAHFRKRCFGNPDWRIIDCRVPFDFFFQIVRRHHNTSHLCGLLAPIDRVARPALPVQNKSVAHKDFNKFCERAFLGWARHDKGGFGITIGTTVPAQHYAQEKAGGIPEPHSDRRAAAQELLPHLRIAFIPGRLQEQRDRLTQRVLNLFFGGALHRNIEGEADRLPLAGATLGEADKRSDFPIPGLAPASGSPNILIGRAFFNLNADKASCALRATPPALLPTRGGAIVDLRLS